ncbi:MAG: glutathione S-transferase N-terminal domain-containing protein [Agarilytica sp.]
MKLYFKPGACSMASHIILNETNKQFELEKTDTETGLTESGENFLEVNPNGYVPALKTSSGEIITENPAILQFIGDSVPDKNLTPQDDPLARTRLHEILNFISSELHKSYGPFFSGEALDEQAQQTTKKKYTKKLPTSKIKSKTDETIYSVTPSPSQMLMPLLCLIGQTS